MFAAIFWMSTAALTILWAATGGEWWGLGVCALLSLRAGLLGFIVVQLCDSKFRATHRRLHKPQTPGLRLGDYAIDFLFLLTLGWITQTGAHGGIVALMLYVLTLLLWGTMTTILEHKR